MVGAEQHQRKNIYGASMKKWSSHRVDSPSDIVHTGSFEIGGHRMYTLLKGEN